MELLYIFTEWEVAVSLHNEHWLSWRFFSSSSVQSDKFRGGTSSEYNPFFPVISVSYSPIIVSYVLRDTSLINPQN